jgi:predicted MFS family arabinose efflux permease
MVGVATYRALLIGGLGVAVLLDLASLPLLFVVFFLLASAETLFDIAVVAVLPSVVPPDDLPRANARLAGLLTITNQFVGPPLGGCLFGAAAALPFLMGAGGLLAAAALLALLRGRFRVSQAVNAPPSDLRREIGEGLRWLWRHRLLRSLSVALGVLNLTLVAQSAVSVLYAQERLGLGPTGFGMLVATYGMGGVLGSMVAHRIVRRLGASRTLRMAIVVEMLVPAALALTENAVLAGVVFTVFGFHAIVWGAVLVSLRQELTPARLRGRVQSAHRLLEEGTAAPGALLGGLLAAGLGLTAPFWFGAVVGALLLPLVWPVFSEATVAEARRRAAWEASREPGQGACSVRRG